MYSNGRNLIERAVKMVTQRIARDEQKEIRSTQITII
jgi:hypothetical protein